MQSQAQRWEAPSRQSTLGCSHFTDEETELREDLLKAAQCEVARPWTGPWAS